MKKYILSLSLMMTTLSLFSYQNPSFDYSDAWSKVNKALIDQLPKTALIELEAIITAANEEKESIETVKAFVFKTRLILDTEELGLEKVIDNFNTTIALSNTPSKQILQTAMAELMQNYFQNNYYILSQRTDIANYIPTDIRTWSPNQYRSYINSLYLESVDSSLSKYPSKDYELLLRDLDNIDYDLRPSLYELMLDRALKYFSNGNLQAVAPSFKFKIDKEDYFLPARQFSELNINSKDTSSQELQVVLLYQEAIKLQLRNKNQKALAEYDLLRYNYLNRKAEILDKDNILIKQYEASKNLYSDPFYKDAFTYLVINLYQKTDRLEQAISIAKELQSNNNRYGLQAKQWLKNIYQPSLSIKSESLYSSQEDIRLSINYKNLSGFYISLYDPGNWVMDESVTQGEKVEQIIALRKLSTKAVNADSISYYNQTESHTLAPQKIGKYLVVLHSKEDLKASNAAIYYATIQVTDLHPTFYTSHDKDYFIVRDRATGKPLEADIYLEKWEYNRKLRKEIKSSSKKFTTDKEGLFYVPKSYERQRNVKVRFVKANDHYDSDRRLYFNQNHESNGYTSTEFFLDRSIYRPGQTVYFKGLHIGYNKNRVPKIISNKKLSVILKDANYLEVSKLQFTTSEYGSFNGSFTLPTGLLTGNFSLQSSNGSISFSVEEYKRPTFEVSFEEQSEDLKLGSKVTVKGSAKAYSGAVTNDAKVEYTVYRELRYYWRYWNPRGTRTLISRGEAKTDKSGAFEINFTAEKDGDLKEGENPSYLYSIEANVTDINGETRSKSTSISIAVVPYYYSSNLKKIYDLSEIDSLKISAIRNTGEKTSSKALLTIQKLKTPNEWKKPNSDYLNHYRRHGIDHISTALSEYEVEREILNVEINIDQNGYSRNLKGLLKQGSYKLLIKSIEEFDGSNAEMSTYLVVNDFEKENIEPAQLLYTLGETTKWNVGQEVMIKLASPEKDLYVYYAFLNDQKIKKEGWVKLNKTAQLKYKTNQSDKGGISLHLDYNYKNTFESRNLSILIPWEEKKLDIQMTSFRSILEPGSEEKWSLKISGLGKETVAAELLASMYDKSLDQYKAQQWNWSGFPSHYGNLNLTPLDRKRASYRIINYQWNRSDNIQIPYKNIPALDINFAHYMNNGKIMRGIEIMGYGVPQMEYDNASTGMMRAKSKRSNLPTKSINELATTSAGISTEMEEIRIRGSRQDATDYYIDGIRVSESEEKLSPNFDFVPRKNLDETVFFYPNLMTDREGNIILEFTMNEALTTWKLMCFAHDKDLRYGFSTEEIKTQKELMIQPNAPRFFREGDQINFIAKVSNLSDSKITAYAYLELKDAANDNDLNPSFLKSETKVLLEIPANESLPVKWNLEIPRGFKSSVKYTVRVSNNKHTDGEENILPVVTNRKLVTETKVFHLKKQQEKTLNITELTNLGSASATPFNLTMEYTANPVWYAIQSLPYIMDYPHKCTEQIFHRYYANTLASHIANASPKIKEIFDVWKTSDTDAFLSNLDKNEELKYAILEETPWVRNAQSEAEQKKRIALLFDYNKMSIERTSELARLKKRQLPSGAFPWFEGMIEDVYITQLVVEGLLHLQKLGVVNINDPEIKQIVSRATEYLHEQSKKRYDDLLERKRKYDLDLSKDHLDHLSIQYLYICSFDPDLVIPQQSKIAFDYYYNQSITYWRNKNLMAQSLIGLTLYRSTEKTYEDITSSLKEKSFYSDEIGRYWNLGNGYRWYELPIESHATLIEYFTEIGDKEYHEDLKIWLLKNKQTNHWSTTKSTARAIYALLISGEQNRMSQWIHEANVPDLTIDNNSQNMAAWGPEAGTGYIKKTWNQSDDMPTNIAIKNNNETIAFGAIYNQYFEDLDKIEAYGDNPLFIDRKLFIERQSDYGPKLELIEKNSALVPGDRIITRITIKTDRSMSYVHLKDMRGSGMEPENVLSRYKYQGSFGYYESTRDLASHFFIGHLPKGTHVFEYPVRVVHEGTFSTGIATIQCMYAPEFTSHSEGEVVKVVAVE